MKRIVVLLLWCLGLLTAKRKAFVLSVAWVILCPIFGLGQVTFHFHKETIPSLGVLKLLTDPPDGDNTYSTTVNLKNQTGIFPLPAGIKYLSTPAGTRLLQIASVMQFKLWLNKTANYGTIVPRVTLYLSDDYNDPFSTSTQLCQGTGSEIPWVFFGDPALLTIGCTLSSSYVVGPNQVFWAALEVNVTSSPGNHNTYVRFHYEDGVDSTLVVASVPWSGPVIASLSPTTAYTSTVVTVNGSGFGATQGASTLKFDGVVMTPTNWSDSSIQFVAPGTPSTGPVTVTVNGLTSNTNTLTLIAAPTTPVISDISPTTGPVGTLITVNGTGFGGTQGASTVQIDSLAVTPSSWSDTSIQFTIPDVASTGQVTVTVNGATSNAKPLTVTPFVANLSPTSGYTGSPVAITGTGFSSTQGTSTITFNGVAAIPSNWSNTTIQTAVPAGASTGPVVVRRDGADSNGPTFTIIPPDTTFLSKEYIYLGNALSPSNRVPGEVVPADIRSIADDNQSHPCSQHAD